ncbi:HlyD family efflux transporter periplasmic adaptor subunit [Chitinophaga polysaccharea]|uniref:efflux RND transporter periplasmic adaptor subunit n=1 Tax=Chitinophaga TaxID=79328 RepID=UPI0014556B07|nr:MULTISPECIES: efflux RND transporter periplasmic adaptor subunit [Chitinophaga]NLR60068.1 HlyD family efflux transporter periplasmic adaptor subunit [Chitinophaga polysaccharea]NLU94297.1 HlyD family efflux transporter periplasmic adaptor subunit [Chitinophaga sp. Ak27]
MKKKTLYWLIGILGSLVILLMVLKASGVIGKEEGIKVAVEKAANRNIIEVVTASGKIYPEIEVKVSSDVSGEITDLLVQEGDSVKKGQVLARIYADIYGSMVDKAAASVSQQQAQLANTTAALNSYKAKLAQSKAAYDRNKELLSQKVISRSEFETAEATYLATQADYNAALQQINGNRFAIQSAKADLNEANKNLGRTTISAPMSGIISLLSVKKGERVVGTAQMTGTEMLRIANMSTMEVQVDVGENDIPKVKYGDTAIIEVDAYNNRQFKGIVTQIASSSKGAATATVTTASSAEQVTSYIVHIRILPESYQDLILAGSRTFPFRPGMSASVNIQTRHVNNVLAIPINSVSTRDSSNTHGDKDKKKQDDTTPGSSANTKVAVNEVVFVLQKDGTVKMVTVKTGVQDDAWIQILSGINEGDQVISAPYTAISRTLENGKKVKIVPKSELFEGQSK